MHHDEQDKTEILHPSETDDRTEFISNVLSGSTEKSNAEMGENREPFHLEKGTVLKNKYIVGEVIGFGGFGTIYLCHDNVLDEKVAVKEYYPTIFLSRERGKKEVSVYDKKNVGLFEKGKKEFLDEAQNLAKFNKHTNIVHVYDFFEENGTAYFVMEYLDGCNLNRYMQEKRKAGEEITVSESVEIVKNVLNGLVVLHKEGIIHRDIKPGNIFLCKDGAVKIIDLGAARFSNDETEKTRTVIITPGYAPSEQYQVKSKQGAYTDIYAVGAVLYELLTGIKPDESINRKVDDTLVKASKLNKRVPKNLDAIVLRAMAIQPEIRFQTAAQFLRALESKGKVRDAEKEVSHKKRLRRVYISLIGIVILAGAAIAGLRYERVRREAFLAPSMISLWLPDASDTDEVNDLYHDMTQEFIDNYDMVTLNITVIPAEQYKDRLMNAFEAGDAPTIFRTDQLIGEVADYVRPLDHFFEMGVYNDEDYILLDKLAKKENVLQIPLTVDIPVLYTKNSGQEQHDSHNTDIDAFVTGEHNCYLGTVGDYGTVQEVLPGAYEVLLPELSESEEKYYDLYSINANATEDEVNAALRLLYYLLSETSQDIYTVQHDNHLPLNRSILNVFSEVNNDFVGIAEYIDETYDSK